MYRSILSIICFAHFHTLLPGAVLLKILYYRTEIKYSPAKSNDANSMIHRSLVLYKLDIPIKIYLELYFVGTSKTFIMINFSMICFWDHRTKYIS